MKIITLGLSPYLYLSDGRIHALVLEHLFRSEYSVAAIGISHDTSYFLPKQNEKGEPVYYYEFDKYQIPLVPFNNVRDPAIGIHEILKVFEPDMIITIGDLNSFLYMKAVKMFNEKPIQWFAILSNHSYPVNEQNIELLDDMDGILCTNSSSFDMFNNLYKREHIDKAYVGGFKTQVKPIRNSDFRIITTSKNTQSNNIPMIMEAAAAIRLKIPELRLYLHTNVHDRGDFDLHLLKARFDPKDEFVSFPDKYVSMNEAYSEEDFQKELSCSDVFISAAGNAPTGMAAFDAIACGCAPLLSDVGSHKNIAEDLAKISPKFKRNDFLVPCIEVMTRGEVYTNVCEPEPFQERILSLHEKIKKGGHRIFFQEFVDSYDRRNFFQSVSTMVEAIKSSNPTLCVETV